MTIKISCIFLFNTCPYEFDDVQSSLTGRAIGACLIINPPIPIIETPIIIKPTTEVPPVSPAVPIKPKKYI